MESPTRYSGGDGSSSEEAVIVHAPNKSAGILAEYSWLEDRFGVEGKDYDHVSKDLVFKDGHVYDVHDLKVGGFFGDEVEVWFDTTAWFYGR